jgi:hypothetical protein
VIDPQLGIVRSGVPAVLVLGAAGHEQQDARGARDSDQSPKDRLFRNRPRGGPRTTSSG